MLRKRVPLKELLSHVKVERCKDPSKGDFTSNIALVLCSKYHVVERPDGKLEYFYKEKP